jgi:hypothetical protein
MLTNRHEKFLFWLEGSKSAVVNAIRFSWEEGRPYPLKIDVNLRNKKNEFEKLNNEFKEKKK